MKLSISPWAAVTVLFEKFPIAKRSKSPKKQPDNVRELTFVDNSAQN